MITSNHVHFSEDNNSISTSFFAFGDFIYNSTLKKSGNIGFNTPVTNRTAFKISKHKCVLK